MEDDVRSEKDSMQGENHLVTIRKFPMPSKARLAAAVLRQHGIDAFVHGEHSSGHSFFIARYLEAVHLQVRSGDVERALEVLPEEKVNEAVMAEGTRALRNILIAIVLIPIALLLLAFLMSL